MEIEKVDKEEEDKTREPEPELTLESLKKFWLWSLQCTKRRRTAELNTFLYQCLFHLATFSSLNC